MGPAMFLMRNHHVDSPLRMIMTIHIHALVSRLSLRRLTCLSQTRTIHEKEQAP